jgi:hypothetical protein
MDMDIMDIFKFHTSSVRNSSKTIKAQKIVKQSSTNENIVEKRQKLSKNGKMYSGDLQNS